MDAIIKIENGYWTYNGKKYSNCTFPERRVISSFIINSRFNIDPRETMPCIIDTSIVDEQKYLNCEFVKL